MSVVQAIVMKANTGRGISARGGGRHDALTLPWHELRYSHCRGHRVQHVRLRRYQEDRGEQNNRAA
jgi:hypothetical protein